ncbi:copper chaperone PCu(A)C [Sphingosinicella microcystinivorans]|uniref:copper chaperone PCu(A)C n=1 Tax=Sphingosinicella microcystinivorans TaxID=335406 RepID=UPI0022F3CBE4|nr:copper chaperone PCu(A)C [Sphingosinicella microcystinivorans]WBX84609.1 copper chaperone PCu(A)C [Sphingosinicella microcystinivorans]
MPTIACRAARAVHRGVAPVLAVAALSTVTSTPIAAEPYRTASITVSDAWARETAPAQKAGGGFMIIDNAGNRADRLLSAASGVADKVELHTVSMDGGVMRMRPVAGGIAIPARGKVELRPGSFHIMFMGLKAPLRRGETVPVTLRFARAGTVTARLAVQPIGAMGPDGGHHGHH